MKCTSYQSYFTTSLLMTGTSCCNFFHKEYTEYTTKKGKTVYLDVGAIMLNGKRNLLLRIDILLFIDPIQFLVVLLDDLVKQMWK